MWPFTRKREWTEQERKWATQIMVAEQARCLNLDMLFGFGPSETTATDETHNCGFCGRGGLVRGQSCPGCGAAD